MFFSKSNLYKEAFYLLMYIQSETEEYRKKTTWTEFTFKTRFFLHFYQI